MIEGDEEGMELKVKTGANLRCGYSNQAATVLVKICFDEGGKTTTTEWICREVLESAIRIMDAAGSVPVAQLTEMAAPQHLRVASVESHHAIMSQKQVVPGGDKLAVEALRVACEELANNPPPNLKGEPAVTENHIRSVVERFRARFASTRSMYPVLAEIFGMPRERFEVVIGNLR